MNTVIEISEPISEQLSKDIRDNLSFEDYHKIGSVCELKGSYLRAIVYRQCNVTKGSKKAIETLIRLAIQNSQSKLHQRQRLIDALDECESEALQKLNEAL